MSTGSANSGGSENPPPWIDRFPGLSRLPAEIKQTLVDHSALLHFPRGKLVFGPGQVPDKLLLLLEGSVRVQQCSESGREIVLYRVEAGQSCVLTNAFLLAEEAHAAEGYADGEVTAVAIPHATFDELIARSRTFRDFVFSAYTRRIADLIRVVDDVAFGRIDVRLAERLIRLAADSDEIEATHHQLATELGTAREVISRQLQEFQRRGWIAQSRGCIRIVQREPLRQLSQVN